MPSTTVARGWTRWLPWGVVAMAVAFNLVTLWPEANPGQYLNDSSIHASMVRWASGRIEAGHLPFDGWYPYLSLGASRFHHYQALPAIVTGGLTRAFGDGTFAWTGYLLLAGWPIAVYSSSRLLGFGRGPAVASAAVASLVVSQPSMGYEFNSYVWRGAGVWTQLWGMWCLPFAWALTWRAVAQRRSLTLGALALGLTMCIHLLTGYLAMLSLGVWVLIAPREFLVRLRRAAAVALGAIGVAAWMLVPVIVESTWVTQDRFSRGTLFYDSFGAGPILGWFFSGELFDARRVPVITVLVVIGLAVASSRGRAAERYRMLLGAGGLSLLLFFGRPTLGPILGLLPGSGDLFLRRFIFGVHLAGIWLAGIGAWWILRRLAAWVPEAPRRRVAGLAAIGCVALAALAPAWIERADYLAQNRAWISEQRAADATDGAALASLVARARAIDDEGRFFGLSRPDRSNRYKVGQAPVFASLLNLDVDAIGFTRPTWSLLSNVETRFDPGNEMQMGLFGVRWIVLPAGLSPRVPATEVSREGRHVLWGIEGAGYFDVVDTHGSIEADRGTLADAVGDALDGGTSESATLPTVAFAGRPAAAPTWQGDLPPPNPPGVVIRSGSAPEDGAFAAEVQVDRPAMVLLKQSFEPRWRATVDGTPTEVQMVAPGMPAVRVGPGVHQVAFRFQPYPYYLPLFLCSGVAVAILALVDWRVARSRRAMPGSVEVGVAGADLPP